MDQRAAFDATIELARERGMGRVTPRLDPDLTFAHLLDMQSRITPDMSEAKLGRWLGWAQAAVVAANVGVTLDDMKAINKRFADDAPTPRTVTTVEELEAATDVVGGKPFAEVKMMEVVRLVNASRAVLATVLSPAPSTVEKLVYTGEQVEAIKAEAWDEGRAFGYGDAQTYHNGAGPGEGCGPDSWDCACPNPYRAALDEAFPELTDAHDTGMGLTIRQEGDEE